MNHTINKISALDRAGNPLLFMISACLAMVGFGAIVAGVGPSYTALAANTQTSVADVSAIFSALFAGGFISQMVSGWLIARLNIRVMIGLCMVIFGLAVFGFTLAPTLPVAIMFGFVCGLCDGPVGVIINLTMALVYGKKGTQRIGVISTFFGIGSVLCPAVISIALTAGIPPLIGLWGGAVLLIIVAPLMAWSIDTRPYHARRQTRPRAEARLGRPAALFASPLFWCGALLLLIYVGIEQGIGAWTTRYVSLTTPYGEAAGAQLSSGYWLAFTFSRFMIGMIGARSGPHRLLMLCMAGSIAGAVLLFAGAGNLAITAIGTLLIGFCFGPIFPIFFPLVAEWFPHHAGLAAGIISASGSLGGLLLNSAQGAVIENAGPGYNPLFVGSVLIGLIAVAAVTITLAGSQRQADMSAVLVSD